MHSPAHEIDTAIHAHQGTGSHVADQAIVFDGEIPGAMSSHMVVLLGRALGGHDERDETRVPGQILSVQGEIFRAKPVLR